MNFLTPRRLQQSLRNALVALCFLVPVSAALAETVWIDVRTEAEYASDYIAGDPNIPLDELDPEQLAAQYGKDADIRLYCRSGNRAGQAMELLQAAGFTQTSNVGSITDARNLRELAAGAAASNASGAASAANR